MASHTPVDGRTRGRPETPRSPRSPRSVSAERPPEDMDPYTPITRIGTIEGSGANQASTSGNALAARTETLFDHVMSREVGKWHGSTSSCGWRPWMPPYTRVLKDFSCGPDNGRGKGTILCDAGRAMTSPVFVMRFSSGRVRYRNLVALGDEEGFVSIIRTTDPVPSSLGDPSDPYRPVGQWRAHRNAIFDLDWANDDCWMYCASGDTKLSLWDTGYASRISTFDSGRTSVKTLSVKADNYNVFASAGRDGDLYIHDARVKETGLAGIGDLPPGVRTAYRPVLKLAGPHSIVASTPSKTPKFGHSRSGVTSLCFLRGANSSVLASGGQEGRIKLWDLRYTADPVLVHEPLVDKMKALSDALCDANQGRSIHNLASMGQPMLSQRVRGVTSLSLHPDGTLLLASYIGGQHLIFDVNHPDKGPCQWFGGNLIDSFYVKSAFSPDGAHIISGSSDSNAYIYSLGDRQGTNPIVLTGHASEVTAVAWNPYDQCQIMTAGNDHLAKFWSVDTSLTQEKEKPQSYDPKAVLQDRLEYEKRRVGMATVSRSAGGPLPRPKPREGLREALQTPVRTPLRIRNVLLEDAGRPQKRKAARQLTISDALIGRQKRRDERHGMDR